MKSGLDGGTCITNVNGVAGVRNFIDTFGGQGM